MNMENEVIFVTGANGMLGTNICLELVRQKYEVKALCLNECESKFLSQNGINVIEGNILDKQKLTENIKGCDKVIHIAALTGIWPRRCEKIKEVNVRGTMNIVAAAKENNIKRIVHIGSASSFQGGCKNFPGNEASPFLGKKYKMDYIDTKYEAQEYLMEEYRKNQLPVLIINPTFMIGAFDSGPSSGKMLISLYKNQLPGYSSGGKNFVCSTDVAKAVVNALTLGRTGECYIAGSTNLTYAEFFKIACKVMNKPFKMKKIPHFAILAVGFINSISGRIIGKAPKLSYGVARMSNIEQYYHCEKAVSELQMTQTPIEVGIRSSIEWFLQNKYC